MTDKSVQELDQEIAEYQEQLDMVNQAVADNPDSEEFLEVKRNLEDVLRTRGLDTLLITGTVTNVCCESTARDAMMRNFKTVMVTDGNAANTDEDHNAALSNFYLTFGDIMSTDFAIGCLTRNAQKGLAAAE